MSAQVTLSTSTHPSLELSNISTDKLAKSIMASATTQALTSGHWNLPNIKEVYNLKPGSTIILQFDMMLSQDDMKRIKSDLKSMYDVNVLILGPNVKVYSTEDLKEE